MKRFLAVAVSAGWLSASSMLPVGANSHEPPPPPGSATETYSVLAPSPMPVHSSAGGCTVGTEDVHKDSRFFKVARAGTLTATVRMFSGDWDIGIVDVASGKVLQYAAHAISSAETVSVLLAVNQAVNIVPCNFAGGPTATVTYFFTPAEEQLVSVGDVAVAEGDGGARTAVFTVGLSKPPVTMMAVNYATANGSADAGLDYTATSGALFFNPGVTSATVKVPIAPDSKDEPDEFFRINLSSARPAGVTIGDGSGLGTILDDDPGTGKRLVVGDVAVPEGDAATRAAVFTVTLSKASTATVRVNYVTADATATAPADYTATSGTLSFAPGATAATIKVPVEGDLAVENDETFTVILSGASGAIISDASGLGTILDDM